MNIAFKYLYLFCDIKEVGPDHFKFCHFAIDSITLVWYKKHVDLNPSVGNWSNIDYPEYIEIQKNIRTYLFAQSKYPKEPFFAEFEIWSQYAF